MSLEQKNPHERDKRISFDEEPHIYYLDGEALDISVTGFVHKFFSEFDAKKIIEKFYAKWQLDENNKYYGMSPEEIEESWERNRDTQAIAGTKMHAAIEDFYNGKPLVDDETLEIKFFKKFHNEHNNLEPFRTEWMVFAEDLKLAGSIDMVFKNDGILEIYDWKRSKEIKEQNRFQSGKYPLSHLPDTNFWHYSLQLNIYKRILEKYYNKKVGDLFLVVLHPNNLNYIKLKVPNLNNEVDLMFEIRKKAVN